MTENESYNPITLEYVHETLKNWLYLEASDLEYVDIVLAAALDRDIPGDPLWLEVIGPSGAMKSELLRAVSTYHKCYTLDTMTTNTFVSGSPSKDGQPKGILQDLDGKIVVLKDFGVILAMPDKERYEIFAQFRQVYDGTFEKATGNMRKKVTVHATIGLILGCTPNIDHHQQLQTKLGERFLKVRQSPNGDAVTKRAVENLGKEAEMRRDISMTIGAFFGWLNHPTNTNGLSKIPEPTKKQTETLRKLAIYVSKMRAWVYTKVNRQGELYDMEVPEPEIAGRVVKQLKKLVQALAIVRGHDTITEEEMNAARRVARQTAIPKRLLLIEALMNNPMEEVPIREVVNQTGMLFNSLRIAMFEARGLGILDCKEEVERGPPVFSEREREYVQPKIGTSYFMTLNADFKPFVEATITIEEVEA